MTLEERLEAIEYLKRNAKYSDFGNQLLRIMQDLEDENKNLSQRADLLSLDLTAAQEIMGCLKEENEKLRANNEKLCEIAREAKSKTTGNILAALNLNSFIKPTPPKD